jgi:hypothetical protein
MIRCAREIGEKIKYKEHHDQPAGEHDVQEQAAQCICLKFTDVEFHNV